MIDLEEILKEHCNTTFNKHNGEEEIISSKEAVLIAMHEACNQTVDACAEAPFVETEADKNGILSLSKAILNVKNQIR